MVARIRNVEFDYVKSNFDVLLVLFSGTATEMNLVSVMNELVPNFLSKKSNFEKLDLKSKIYKIN
jgi:hypothetical protein